VVLAYLAGCYDPVAAPNVPCGPGGACPSEQTCDPSGVCVAPGTESDAPPIAADAAEPDAAPDARITVAPQLRSFVAVDGNSMSTTIMSPAGTVPGDLLVAHVNCDGCEPATDIPTPPGWVRLIDRDGAQDTFVVVIFHRFAIADSESFTFTFPNNLNFIHLLAFSGVDPASPVDAFDGNALTDTSQPTAPSITTSQPRTLLVALFTLDLSNDTFKDIAGMTELYDEFTGQLQVSASIAEAPTAGPTGDRVAVRDGTDPGPTINFAIALAPTR
jgi:hypothetical protein